MTVTKEIIVKRAGRGAYGNEYKVEYIKDGRILHSEIMFAQDVKSADRAFTKEFEGIPIRRKYGKKMRRL